MAILEQTQFKNKNDDKVDVRLLHNNGEFEVIVNVEATRRTIEKRFRKVDIVELSVMKFTHEIEVIKTTVERSAWIEYHMRRTLNGDPSLPMAQFQEWLRATDTTKED